MSAIEGASPPMNSFPARKNVLKTSSGSASGYATNSTSMRWGRRS
jgi:tetrahydromethanopterin S-methyltransferase subunit B